MLGRAMKDSKGHGSNWRGGENIEKRRARRHARYLLEPPRRTTSLKTADWRYLPRKAQEDCTK